MKWKTNLNIYLSDLKRFIEIKNDNMRGIKNMYIYKLKDKKHTEGLGYLLGVTGIFLPPIIFIKMSVLAANT